MLKKYKGFSFLFLVIFTLQILSDFYSLSTLQYIARPAIVLSLMVFFYMKTKLHGRFHQRLFTGLLFIWFGDLILMLANVNPSYFIFGLIPFLIGHIFYTRAFYLDFRSAQELDKKGARIAISLCAIFGMGFYIFLRPYVGLMKLPVMIYIFVICMLLMMSVFRNQRVNRISFNLVFAGTSLLVLSDCLLVYTKFVGSFHLTNLLMIGVYMAAQYLIVIGAVERKLLNN